MGFFGTPFCYPIRISPDPETFRFITLLLSLKDTRVTPYTLLFSDYNQSCLNTRSYDAHAHMAGHSSSLASVYDITDGRMSLDGCGRPAFFKNGPRPSSVECDSHT